MPSPREFFIEHAADEPWHVERFCRSWNWVGGLLEYRNELLDVGGPGPFSAWLRECGWNVAQTTSDLRYPLALPSDQFDGITMTEVIEHIKDQDGSGNLAQFDGSGIRCCLAELHRVCKPAGWLFLTTPNVCSYRAVQKIMRGEHPFQFPPHHRELTPGDVASFVTEAGWRIDRQELVSVWNDHHVSTAEKSAMMALAEQFYGSGSPLYGDSIFVVARKC